MAEVLKKLLSSDIQKNLYPNNEFYKKSKVDAGVQADVTTVQIPQAGAVPTVVENPTSFPLTIAPRVDSEVEYAVDVIATEPIVIQDDNELVLSYSKRQDVLQDHVAVLNTRVADKLAHAWSAVPATNQVRTTGADSPVLLTGATGTRKRFSLPDFINAMRIMDNMDAGNNRIALFSANMYAELITASLSQFVGSDKLSSDLIAQGVVGKLFNTLIYVRSRTCRYTNAATPLKKIYTAANAATDNDSILIFDPSLVRRAEGIVKVYSDLDNPAYLGSIYNAKIRAGGTASRTDFKGIVSIIQAVGA